MNSVSSRLRRSLTFMTGAGLLLAIAMMAIIGPWLYPQGPWSVVATPMTWPGMDWSRPLGTDALGRDILAGLLHGARVSLLIGGAATLVALCVGIAVGTATGYFGGWIDDALMRLVDAVQTVPPFLLAIVVVLIVNPSVGSIVGSIAQFHGPRWPAWCGRSF
ncbi:MAG: ABC transporter permease, partial [Betaproteobacteria bacterium]